MKLMTAAVMALLLGMFMVTAGNAAEEAATKPVTVSVPNGGKVTMKPPASWKQNVLQPGLEIPPTVTFTSSGSNAIALKITWIPDPAGKFSDQKEIDATVTRVNQQYIPYSVEKGMELKHLSSKNGKGAYATFTDAKLAHARVLPPGEFICVASGMIVVGKQAGAFTLLSNKLDTPEFKQAFQFISDGIVAE